MPTSNKSRGRLRATSSNNHSAYVQTPPSSQTPTRPRSGSASSTTSDRSSIGIAKPNPTDSPRRKVVWNSSTSLTQKRSLGVASKPPSGRASTSQPTSGPGKSPSQQTLRQQYEALLGSKNGSDNELREALRKLRRMVLTEGLPNDVETFRSPSDCSLRGRIWKVLLGIYRLSSFEYFNLIERGPSSVYDKIKNDTFRTLATDKNFLSKVDENMLSRVLNAFVWKMEDLPPSRLLNLTYTYVQGMNVLAAPFLYVMPELDAFYTFTAFIQHACPLYVQPALEGVHCGLKLLDRCLQVCDPSLYRYLKSKRLTATVYAFPSVMTFSACTPPLTQLLPLWDFYLSYGIHLNILCIISQIILIRDQIMSHPSPMRLLRTFPDLNAKELVAHTVGLVPRLPEDLYDMLVRHTFDAGIYDVVMGDDGEAGGAGVWMGEGGDVEEI
ncbi:uncharacterized protein SPPG_02246 [Spizellomyces punctatus DAOM BR117]|uniref:Rab-GAP TBC domain-containing protein n=1 Tax=Spizellomyces punctatus (strain DAOM BR117) TaxID=645134 RepID=A0A0L0HQ64_SPIPD|nr:uncharacterized protein SPPG_02246 [Spizellomyces punctatus DAOM BR117]KND03188.1 hypothetical protein SPPG_02246 [Spizellomyces punctatus DAOM BR117]|eukprot:XP_016611227.1 hypothetical protein SPPG_02246 [Spizellomyces punctatus DAOM BR117]